MNKNSLLSVANFFCNFFKLLIGILIIAITIAFIHFQFDRDFYNEWSMEKPENGSVIRFEREAFLGQNGKELEKLKVTDWKTVSLYFTYLKFTATLILFFLAIHQFSKVLKSVRRLKTFKAINVGAFRKIGYYCLGIAALSFFNYWGFENYTKSSISVSLDVILIALIAFILAEIFKEGNILMEENQLTV